MTIRVNIKNEDPRETAVIRVQTIDPATNAPYPHGLDVELKGGQSQDVYVHSSSGLAITEVPQ